MKKSPVKSFTKRRVFILTTALAVLSVFLGCSADVNSPDEQKKSISLSATKTSIEEGETTEIKVDYENVETSDQKVTWKSSNTAVATVSNGTVKGVSEGTATITATLTSSSSVKDSIEITVTAATKPYIKADISEVTLLAGGTKKVTLEIKNVEDQTVTWSSSDEKVATVSDGTITAVAAGSATITAALKSYPSVKAEIAVTVESGTITTGGDIFWKAEDYTAGTISSTTTLGVMTAVIDNSSNNMTIDSTSQTIDGETFTARIKTNGSGSKAKRALKFDVTGACTITAYCASGSSSGTGRKLVLANDENTLNESNEAPTTAGTLVYNYEGSADTLYFYSSSSGINIYGIKIAYENSSTTETPIVAPTGISLDKTSLEIDLGGTSTEAQLTCTLTPDNVTTGYDGVTWTSSSTGVATVDSTGKVKAVSAGETTITATTVYGSYSATCTVTVTGEAVNAIRASDTPTGWAGYMGTKDLAGSTVTPPANYGGYGNNKVITVTTASDLQSYAKKGGYVIYVNGMIDMTGGMLPSKADGSTTALDTWIKNKINSTVSSVTSLATWKTYYAGGNTNSADESGEYKTNRQTLSNAWGNMIKISPASNTTIIGLTSESGVKGGCFKIAGVSNVVIRNMIIQDPFDPFPQIEKGDGFNANYDAIEISGQSKYIWIDHCTFQDTIAKTDDDFDHIKLSDKVEKKYQVFDGLCDIKQANDFITVSNCKFMNHDKTSLIGHSADYTDDLNHQTITLHGNYYFNCNQRLPMVRFATIHIYNNLYEIDSTGRGNSYCIGLREQNRVYAENNYFGSGTTATSNNQGNYYLTGNNTGNGGSAAWAPSNYYEYEAIPYSQVPSTVRASAGAGVLTVVK